MRREDPCTPARCALIAIVALTCGCGESPRRSTTPQIGADAKFVVEGLDDAGLNGVDAGLPAPWRDDDAGVDDLSDPETGPSGADAGSVTPPAVGALCSACTDHDECEGQAYCLRNGQTGERFCGRDCSVAACPSGFDCLQLMSEQGVVSQCVPQTQSCIDETEVLAEDLCGNTYETEVLERVNQERQARGVAPLACDLAAAAVARAYSQLMCDEGFFSHYGPDGSTPGGRLRAGGVSFAGAGENVAAGAPTPASAMQGWMQSSGHRGNLLSPSWTHLGVGYARCGPFDTRWTQDFLRR